MSRTSRTTGLGFHQDSGPKPMRLCFNPTAVVCLLLACGTAAPHTFGFDRVKASLQSETAWTGQAVTMVVTLYSPGPFSGTASMDLPEIPRTFFIRNGNPIVGSETVDGESLLTQRHEFSVYTQQTGQVVIPPFEIRFNGKKDFVSEPEPVSGETTELTFESKQPPGQSLSGVVIAVNSLRVQQNWEPADPAKIQAGDVIRRTVTQNASGTSAIMLASIRQTAPEGVRLYTERPEVIDKNERGEISATRTDVIKYQFARPGTFEIPPIEVLWFNIGSEETKRETLPGVTISVLGTAALASGAPTTTETNPVTEMNWPVLAVLIAIILAAWQPLHRVYDQWQESRNRPAAILSRRVTAACQTNDAQTAYWSVIQWQRAVSYAAQQSALDREVAQLARRLFGEAEESTPWSGEPLRVAFEKAKKRQNSDSRATDKVNQLPALNPDSRT